MRLEIKGKRLFIIPGKFLIGQGILVLTIVLTGITLAACTGAVKTAEVTITPTVTPVADIPTVTVTSSATATLEATFPMESQIGGISTIEEVQGRIEYYFSGKEDFSVTGPYKDNLFTDHGDSKPFSYFSKGGGLRDWFSLCHQQGIYLGSFISNLDKSIIASFGTENSHGQRVVEMFIVGYSERPENLPMDFPISYAFVNKKWPSWLSDVKDGVPGIEIPEMLIGKENQIVAWYWTCETNPATVDEYCSFLSRGDKNIEMMLRWRAARALNTEGLASWLQNPQANKPYGLYTRLEEVDLINIDTEKLTPLGTLKIPPIY